jgi:catecholate siderophore receptor
VRKPEQNGTTLQLASAALVAVAALGQSVQAQEVVKLQEQVVTDDRETLAEPGANPNADPQAPYKIDRSANAKFTEPLLNVSKSITVIGKEQLQDAGTTALKDLMRTEPGITLGTGEGGNALGDRFFIRGFDARNDVFVDGLRSPGVTSRELFATEQVEISKGPSSTFAGRGTTGGAVNSVSKKPQQENFTKGSLTLGDDNIVTLDTNRVVSDKLAVRANIMAADSDVSGNEDRYDRKKGIALAADYQATDKASVLVDYYYLDGENMPDYGHPWNSEADAPYDVDPANFYGLTGRDFQETSANVLTGTFEYEFSPYTKLTSRSRVGETTNNYIVGAPGVRDGVSVTSSAKSAGFTNKIVANNTQITHEQHIGSVEHVMTVGVDVSEEQVTNQPYDNDFEYETLDINNPDNGNGSGTVTRREGNSELNATSKAIYFMDTAKFNEHWQVFGGIRYDHFDIDNTGFNYNDGVTTDTVYYDKGYVNGHAGVTYKPTENSSIYGSVSTSSNLPGEMYDGVNSVDYGGLIAGMEDIKPEQNVNFEIGTKWEVVGGDLLVSAALFQMTKSNKVENAAGRGEEADLYQTGEVRISGIELGASGKLTPKLSLAAGVSVMDTEVTKSIDEDSIGRDLANVAEKSASLQLKYQATPKLAIGGTWVHTGEIKGGSFAATSGNSIDSSDRLDLMAEYQINKQAAVQANVKNITDENIYDALYRSGSPFTFTSPGRTANVSFTYDF